MRQAFKSITYIICSICWLFFSIIFVSPLWLDSAGTNSWKEDSMFIPAGFIMMIVWIISLILFIVNLRNEKKIQQVYLPDSSLYISSITVIALRGAFIFRTSVVLFSADNYCLPPGSNQPDILMRKCCNLPREQDAVPRKFFSCFFGIACIVLSLV